MIDEMGAVDPNQFVQMRQMEEAKKKIMTSILTKEAYERLARVRSVNPMFANQVDLYLLQIYQAGKIRQPVNDKDMKEVLQLLSEKRDFSIKRK
jgi:programmed cell death protein 5